MIKALAVSKTAKALGLCVCPVVGAGVVATQVPAVRTAVHKATAPRAYAKPKTRVRAPGALPAPVKVAAIDPCVTNNPVIIQSGQAFNLPELPQSGSILAMNDPTTTSTIPRVTTPPILVNPNPPVIPINPGGPGNPGNPENPGNPGNPEVPVNPVPEPATWAQLVFGFIIIGGVMRSASRPRSHSDDEAAEGAA